MDGKERISNEIFQPDITEIEHSVSLEYIIIKRGKKLFPQKTHSDMMRNGNHRNTTAR